MPRLLTFCALASPVFGQDVFEFAPSVSSDVSSFTIHVVHKPNDPESVAAKDNLRVAFCKKFDLSPCSPDPSLDESALHLTDDLVVNAPASNVREVLAFFQQHRIARLNPPASVDLDLAVHPNTDQGAAADYALSIWAGAPHPVDMNAVYRAHSAPSPMLRSRAKVEDEDLWAFTCSSDAGGEGIWVDLCGPAAKGNYALNSTCRAEAVGAHLHLYNRENNADDDKAKATFMDLATKEFGMSTDICHDDYGHEQPHDTTCWLGGPTGPPGSGSLEDSSGPPGGGSFVTGHYSIYIINDDFAKVMGWTLLNNNAAVFGKDIDYILHPVYGCNFADHQMWALYNGLTPNNLAGIAQSGDWTGDAPPRLDPFGPSAPGATCTCSDRDPSSYDLHFLYDPTNADASSRKDELASNFRIAFPDASFVEDVPYSFTDPKSPFLAGQVHFKLTKGAGSLMEWLAIQGPDNADLVDVLLVPETCCGSLVDYTKHALWAGRPWPLNTVALSEMTVDRKHGFLHRVEDAVEVGSDANYDFLLYVLYAAGNSWQTAAVEEFLSAFSSQFGLSRKECSASAIEPSLSKLCMMAEKSSPKSSDPMTTGYAQVYIPKSSVEEVMSWAMTHRGADRNGYQVDLMMIPLTGDAVSDFNEHALHVGTTWPVNQPAIQ